MTVYCSQILLWMIILKIGPCNLGFTLYTFSLFSWRVNIFLSQLRFHICLKDLQEILGIHGIIHFFMMHPISWNCSLNWSLKCVHVLVISFLILDIFLYIVAFYTITLINSFFFRLWKLNPRYRTISLTKLLIKHAKFTPKETKIGAEH